MGVVEILLHFRRVRNAINDTIHFLADFPGSGQNRENLGLRLRSFPVRRCRDYIIFYRPTVPISGGIEVLRVLHAARDIGQVFKPD